MSAPVKITLLAVLLTQAAIGIYHSPQVRHWRAYGVPVKAGAEVQQEQEGD